MGPSGTTEAALVGSELLATINMAVPTMHTTMMPIAIGRFTVKCFMTKRFFAKCLVNCFAKCVDRFEGMNPPLGSVGAPSSAQTEYRARCHAPLPLSVGGHAGWEDDAGGVERVARVRYPIS